MRNESFLEILFHMVNGQKVSFSEQQETLANDIIAGVNPQKLFNDKQLVVSGDSCTTRILLEAVCCIEFNTSADLNFSFPSHIANVMVLSKDKFLKAIESELEEPEAIIDPGLRTRPVSIFLDIMMRDGSHWYLRVFAETLKPIERIELTKVVRDLTGFHAVKSSGGAVLFNMKNAASWTTHPTALLSSQKTWKIEKS